MGGPLPQRQRLRSLCSAHFVPLATLIWRTLDSGLLDPSFAEQPVLFTCTRSGRLFRLRRHGSRAAAAEDGGEGLWDEALAAERSRSEVLMSQLEALRSKMSDQTLLDGKVSTLRAKLEEAGSGQAAFEELKIFNDALQDATEDVKKAAEITSLPSFDPFSTRLAGEEVTVEILPPARETDGPALVPGAAHVRVSLPLTDNGGLMWGSDLTPLFDEEGARLMAFTAFLPLGMEITSMPRPTNVPKSPGDLLVVKDVAPGSEARALGIEVGDVIRAISYIALGPEPNWFDSVMFGDKAMPMKLVMKCDGCSVEEVTSALQSNQDSPDGRLTLLLERPLTKTTR